MKPQHALVGIALVAALGIGVAAWQRDSESSTELNTDGQEKTIQVVAERLEIPWEIAFLPNGDLLITERSGRLVRVGDDREAIPVAGVQHQGEGGLLGLALHPAFEQNRFIYLYLTTATGNRLTNRVDRYVFNENVLSDRQTIVSDIPGAAYHDGGRLAFGPDGYVYIATGDAGDSQNSQNRNSLAGKILRVSDDGSIPADNPFGNAVYSLGHRNVQGLAWDSSGQLWATEHGRSGLQAGLDELNKIEKGGNYGWPVIQGDERRAGMRAPELHSGANDTWAPSGMTFVNGQLIWAGLRGEALYATTITNGAVGELRTYVKGEYGRLRQVVKGPDGLLYVLTNNRDGRGAPNDTDDRVLQISPATFLTATSSRAA